MNEATLLLVGKNGRKDVRLIMGIFQVNDRILCTCSVEGPQDLNEEEAQWVASNIKIMMNSLGKHVW